MKRFSGELKDIVNLYLKSKIINAIIAINIYYLKALKMAFFHQLLCYGMIKFQYLCMIIVDKKNYNIDIHYLYSSIFTLIQISYIIIAVLVRILYYFDSYY